jgi:hypothetical protein
VKGKRVAMLAALLCGLATGCRAARPVSEIVRITHTSTAGPILPELQWYEEIAIMPEKVVLSRNGRVEESEVNAGSWEIAVDAEAVTTLFEQLAAVDCATIKRIEPDDPPDGGDSESYRITYASGTTCSLDYAPGTTYTNGELVVDPIRVFLANLDLPATATSRHK